MKLKKEFLSHTSGDETYLIPASGAGFSGMVKGNRTLGVIVELLKEDTTEEKIIAAMCERFDAPEETVAEDVSRVITQLRSIGALE